MNLELQIPDDAARVLAAQYPNLSRAALEALALEGYRSMRLSEGQVREMLGFTSRMQVHALLKERGIHLHYSMADLEQDRESSRSLEEQGRTEGTTAA